LVLDQAGERRAWLPAARLMPDQFANRINS
jgi:hypothetical protein